MVAMVLGNFQKRGALLTRIKVGHWPTVLAVGAAVTVVVWTFCLFPIVSICLLPLSGRRLIID